MSQKKTKNSSSRRDFLKHTGGLAAATTLVAGSTMPVHAAVDHTIQVALVGCGGRGTGALTAFINIKRKSLLCD